MDADDATIIKRYKETRRAHPLAEESDSLEGAIALERSMLVVHVLHEGSRLALSSSGQAGDNDKFHGITLSFMLAPLRDRADKIVNTTNLSTAKLKGVLWQMFGREGTSRNSSAWPF